MKVARKKRSSCRWPFQSESRSLTLSFKVYSTARLPTLVGYSA